MIKQIEIQNFQSHKNSTLIMSEGVNIICGTSDSGKTAIIRALRFAVWNRPSGDSIRSTWGGKTSVKVVLDNGSVERIKDKAEEYIINDKTSLKAFGLSVPDEVSKLMNLSDINLQSQMDSVFLLSESSGAVAAHFNKVAGLSKIDDSQMKVESWIRALKSETVAKEKDIERYTELLTKYEGLEKIEFELEVLEELQNQYLANKNKVRDLSKLTNDIRSIQTILDLKQPPEYESEVDSLLAKLASYETLKKEVATLEKILSEIEQIKEETADATLLITHEKAVLNILTLQESYKAKNNAIFSLNTAIKELKRISATIEEKEAEFQRLSAKFKKEMGDHCVLCGSKL